MYDLAKKSREANRAKAHRLASPHGERVDASTWSAPEPLNADAKTGMRPISPRAYKKGGKVAGEAVAARADRKPRKSGGRIGVEMANKNMREANAEREGKKHIGGMKKGGRAHKADGGELIDSMRRLKEMRVERDGRFDNAPLPPRRPAGVGAPPDYDYAVQGSSDVTPRKHGGKVSKEEWEHSKEDLREDRRLAKKHHMTMEQWEKSALDKKHDQQQSAKDLKRGGEAGGKWIAGAIEHPGALHKALKVPAGEKIPAKKLEKATKSDNPKLAKRANLAKTLRSFHEDGGVCPPDYDKKNPGGTRPTGGRVARKAGGRTGKGKTDVNIVIAAGHRGAGPDMPTPPGAIPAGAPPVPGLGAAGAMGRAGGMPGANPAMPVPMPIPVPMPGAGGPGAPMPRKAGGRVYRSYKDMDAGAGSGMGRLEKTEIQERRTRRKG